MVSEQGYEFNLSETGEVLSVRDREGNLIGKPGPGIEGRPGLGTSRHELIKSGLLSETKESKDGE